MCAYPPDGVYRSALPPPLGIVIKKYRFTERLNNTIHLLLKGRDVMVSINWVKQLFTDVTVDMLEFDVKLN